MKVIKFLHTIYIILWFIIMFLLLFPFYLLFSFNKSWNHYAYKLDHLWAVIYFSLCLFKTKIKFEGKKPANGPIIYCANHFSTIDIPSMSLLSKQACYVGKASIKRIPLFGYMFKTLHITVDRSSLKDKGRVYQKYKEALQQGKSLFIFPEGGINSTKIPQQSRYKEGAFKVAIELGIPIVPVSITNNWNVLPDGDWMINDRHILLLVGEEISTANLTLKDVTMLKQKVRNLIQHQINIENHILEIEPAN